MNRSNCWEYKKCGREEGGVKAEELGICPAYSEQRVNNMNHGRNAGRVCWAVSGTLCGGKVQGTFAMKLQNCLQCEFYKTVSAEENGEFAKSRDIIERLK